MKTVTNVNRVPNHFSKAYFNWHINTRAVSKSYTCKSFTYTNSLGLVEKSISNATFIIIKHVQSKLLPFTGLRLIRKPDLNSKNSAFDFWGHARMPALGAFLRDICGKIAGIPQCCALGTTLLIWVQTFFKGYQRNIKGTASKERVK